MRLHNELCVSGFDGEQKRTRILFLGGRLSGTPARREPDAKERGRVVSPAWEAAERLTSAAEWN